MPNPQLVMRSMAAAIKPGGRITISTWGLPQNSPAFTLPGEVIRRHVSLSTADPKEPGLFSLPTPEIHAHLFKDIGLQNIETRKFDCPVLIAESPQAMWEQISTMGGPLVKVISDLQTTGREIVHKDFLETFSSMFPNGRVILTGEAIVTTGVKRLVQHRR